MAKTLEKIFLAIIYLGAAASLAVPLFTDSRFFFPFITTKAFIFRIAVELMLLAYFGLLAVTQKYRPALRTAGLLLTLFIAVAFVSSWLGGNFGFSFWSDMERSEGLLLWLHLWALFVILTAVLDSETKWLWLFDFSAAVSFLLALFALGQSLHLKALLASSGSRVDATIGNAAFLAVYMILNVAMAAYLFIRRHALAARIYYVALMLFFSWVVLATQTRGSVIGLAAGIIVSGVLLAFAYRDNAVVKRISLGAVILVIVASAALYLARQSPVVQNSTVLRRLSSISLTERTAETRLATWQAAWTGWRQKFWLGWGLENFEQVFNKNFPPVIYQKEGSQVWFDRAHNVIFDRGVTTGVVGLLLYLAFLFYPAYKFLRLYFRNQVHKGVAAVFVGFIVAFFIQDLFVFETITTYIVLIFLCAFLSSGIPFESRRWELKLNKAAWTVLAVLVLIAFLPVMWGANLYPAKVNLQAATALRSDPQTEDFFVIVDRFKQVLAAGTYGQQEYRMQFVEFVDQQLAPVGEVIPEVRPVLAYTDEQAARQITEQPRDAKNYLLAMRHYNYTYASLPDQKISRLQQALAYYPKLVELTPARPHIHQEEGYSYLYLLKVYQQNKDAAAAKDASDNAEKYFQKAIDINPAVVESYANLIMLYFNVGDDVKVGRVVELMDQRGVSFRSPGYLQKLLNLARASKRVKWIGYFSEELLKFQPDNVDAWINLALFYATSGDRPKALEIAQKIRSFGGDYIKQADAFVLSVNAGKYEKPQ